MILAFSARIGKGHARERHEAVEGELLETGVLEGRGDDGGGEQMSQWVKAWEYCVKHKDVPDILRRYAQKRAGPILDRKARAKSKPAIRFPKGKDPKVEKKTLHAECEALCKALVFRRDCGDWKSRSGKCIACKAWSYTLQWGHFIEREKAPELRYSVAATAGQCGGCNGPGKGRPWEFEAAIDARDGVGTARAMIDKYYKKRFTWKKTTLTKCRSALIAECQAKGIPVAEVLRISETRSVGEAAPAEPSPSSSPRNLPVSPNPDT